MDFPITDRGTAQAVIRHLQQRASAAAAELREPPPEPEGCCERGCQGCVWEGYFDAVAYWRDEALLVLED